MHTCTYVCVEEGIVWIVIPIIYSYIYCMYICTLSHIYTQEYLLDLTLDTLHVESSTFAQIFNYFTTLTMADLP